MRIKLSSLIVSFIFLSVTFSSCLDSDTTYSYSADPSILAFGLDTVHGKHYKFTIDQVERLIYNKDSMPVGSDTILDRIFIDTLSVAGWVTTGEPQDTLVSTSDSLDLTPAINPEPGSRDGIKLIAHAADGMTMRNYVLQIRVHRQDPDSLTWSRMSDNDPLTLAAEATELKSVLFQDQILLYTSAGELWKHGASPASNGWNRVEPLQGFPATALLSSIRPFGSQLVMMSAGGDLYQSADGSVWNRNDALSGVEALVATFPSNQVSHKQETLTALKRGADGQLRFVITTDGASWTEGEVVPDGFPAERLSYTTHLTANGVAKAVVVGQPFTGNAIAPWFSLDGMDWASLAINDDTQACPALENPFIAYYDNLYYCFGGSLDALYTSQTGISWTKCQKKTLLPKEMAGAKTFTALHDPTVSSDDKRDYLWVITAGEGTSCTVWRGRINRLGFIN